MTIKRKTQLNLSGSHRTLDADNAFVGGFLFVTGSVSASVGVSASVLEGTTVTAADTISGSTGRFTYLSGALSASSTGLPFLVAGSNVTTTFSHTDLNWTIAATGGGGSVAGSDTQVQFNNNGAFAASSSFTHTSGTLGVHALSGSLTSSGTVFGDIGHNGNILKITSNVLVTQSAMLFNGVDSALDSGGVVLVNGAGLSMFSGSLGEDPPFGISPSNTPDQVYVKVRGELTVNSGSLTVNSGSGDDQSFTIEPSSYSGKVDVNLKGAMTITSGSFYVNSGSAGPGEFRVVPSNTAGQVNVDLKGAMAITSGSFYVNSGSDGPAEFRVFPSSYSGKVDAELKGAMTITSGSFYVNSGSSSDSSFQIGPSFTAGQVNVTSVGTADFVSGAVNLTFGSTLNVHSASQSGTGFAVIPDTTAGTVRLDINGRLFSNGTNISALTGSLRTGGAYGEPDSNIMSGSLLTAGMVNGSVGKFRVEVIGAAINGDQFISADLIVAASQSAAGVYGTFGVTEVTLDAIGTNALGWDVNINTNGDIAVTSSTVGVDWYAQVSKKMILSGSGIVIY